MAQDRHDEHGGGGGDDATTHPDEVFNAARRLADPAERRAYLDRACAGDAGLRQRVEALLAAYEQAASFLESPAPGMTGVGDGRPGAGATIEPAMPAERVGETIGRYKLLERIGEGGFGVVYMAEQHHPVRRRVALKVVKPGMDSGQVLARFDAERQALAIMDHPNIAKVFDGGMTDSGRPYFVMELVRGEPITEFCDRTQLAARQRLELFAQVCHAVQHAHQKGIIHRDIKPTNVLVALHDATPVVKVIDFGIAKALGQELTEKTLFTGFGQLLGTPLYMSPEQAGRSALDADTRSDIYSLGVLLYELLTGSTPFDKERFRQAAHDEVRRIIREEEPPRPSTRLSESKASLASISARRDTEPGKLTRLVRGELDWIVMKALEKDRNRRYETANAFAHDVERFLNDEIVQARPPTGLYRFRKLVRRNRLAVAASAAVGAALLVGAIVSTTLAIRLKHTADAVRAEQGRTSAALAQTQLQKEAAEEATAEAEAVNAFLTDDIIGAANPDVQRGRKLTVEEAVENAAAKVGKTFKDRPLIEASVRDALVRTLHALGRYDQAAAHAKPALDLRRRLLGEDDPRTLRSLASMGNILECQGKLSEAEPLLREALARSRRVLGDDHANTRDSIEFMGDLLVAQGKPSEAEPLYREVLQRNRRLLGDDHRDTISSIGDLGHLLMNEGKLAEAEPLLREELERTRRVEGNDYPYAQAIRSMGVLLQTQRRFAEAEALYREKLERDRRLLGDDHPNTLLSIRSMALVLEEQGKLAEAEPLYREGLERSRRVLGDDHTDALTAISDMGALLWMQGKLSEAEPLLRETLERSRGALGDDHPKTMNSIQRLGLFFMEQGKLSEAEPLHREALERRRRVLGDDDPYTINSIHNMAVLLQNQNKLSDSESLYREAVERGRRVKRDDDPEMLVLTGNMGALLAAQGNLAEAEPLMREALEGQRRVLGDRHHFTINSIRNMAELLQKQDKLSEAELLLREVAGPVGGLRILEAGSPENLEFAIRQAKELKLEGLSALDLLTCGEYLLLAGEHQKAVDTIEKAIAAGGSQPFYQKSLGWALLRLGRGEQARTALRAAMAGNSATTRAASTQPASPGPTTRPRDDVDDWTAAYLLGATGPDEYVRRWEGYPSLVWFYIGEKLDMSGDRPAALAAYRRSANQSTQHRTTTWAAYRIKQITGKYEPTTTRQEIDQLTLEIAKEPNVPLPIYQRALLYGRSGRFAEAAADFRRVLELDPRDHMDWYHLACLLAYLGETDEHRAVCRDAFARFGAEEVPEIGERLAKASLLLPGGAEDPAAAMRWMDRAIAAAEAGEAPSDYGPWFRMSKGLAEYRAGEGHYQAAADWLDKAAADLGHHGHGLASCGYYRAMALHQLAKPDEARAALDAAERLYTGLDNTPGGDNLVAGGLVNWLICQIARREAKALCDPAP